MEHNDYGVIGGVDPEAELEEEKIEANAQNEWEKALKQYLLKGGRNKHDLVGGRPAISGTKTGTPVKQVSSKQRAAVRR